MGGYVVSSMDNMKIDNTNTLAIFHACYFDKKKREILPSLRLEKHIQSFPYVVLQLSGMRKHCQETKTICSDT